MEQSRPDLLLYTDYKRSATLGGGSLKRQMKAIAKTRAGPGAQVITASTPKIRSGDVLIEIKATSICGTDVDIYDWTDWARSRMKLPTIFGHECCGTVVEVGDSVHSVNVGDYVSTETHIADGTCEQCRNGHSHICENLKLIGVNRPGVFAEYASVPATNIWINDPGIPPIVATTQEPLGNAVHTVFQGEIAMKKVAVFGLGPIGICAALVSQVSGADQVIAVETSEYRLKLAKRLGVRTTVNAGSEDPVEAILSLTNGKGVDVLLEMSGAEKALSSGLKVLRAGGRASILGLYAKPVSIDINELIVLKDLTVHGVFGRLIWDSWYKVSALLRSGVIDLEGLVTHRFSGLQKFHEAMAVMKSRKSGKVVIFP